MILADTFCRPSNKMTYMRHLLRLIQFNQDPFKPSKQRWRRTQNVLKWVLPDTGQSLTMPRLQNTLSKVYQMIFTNFTAYCVTKHFPATISYKPFPQKSVSNPARTKLHWTCFGHVTQLKQVLRKK